MVAVGMKLGSEVSGEMEGIALGEMLGAFVGERDRTKHIHEDSDPQLQMFTSQAICQKITVCI